MEKRQKLIIIDIDGTFADSKKWQKQYFTNGNNNADEYHKHIMDFPVNKTLLKMVKMYIKNGYSVLFLSARPDKYFNETVEWLKKVSNNVIDVKTIEPHTNWYLSLKHPTTLNNIDWKLQYCDGLSDFYDIELIIDDNPKICKALRKAGYMILQMESLYE